MGEYNVSMTRDEWLLLLNAAAKQPYEVVAAVMMKIQNQLGPQLQQDQQAVAPHNHGPAQN